MRPLLLVMIICSACTPLDPLLGTYNVTVTGTDTQTAPTNSTANVTGPGTLAITSDKERVGYVITFGQEGYLCRVKATRNATEPAKLDVPDGQTCIIGGFTATTTDGSVSVDKDTMSIGTLTVAYSYSGQVVFNVSGTGTRTYSGPRL